ncbi:uncharacterized protein LOC134178066 isoform X2 [Corticium candelabrum]|uniref:uncharacterized protein LOC134178066 isoform X2 n=1 Tax=Corticium candelabrum TaxID=121492 RepID=UPI002E26887C|nr:uncharacterized protein LOC134178066 isoform X2 [Corticium candelabrum]
MASRLKQVFALPHRTDVMLNEQFCLVQDAQTNLEKALGLLKSAETEEDAASRLASVQALRSRTDELIVMLQLLVKIRTELAHCMRDVEKARKEGRDVASLGKRVRWLEDRLEKLLLSRRKMRRTRPTRQTMETRREPRREPFLSSLQSNDMVPDITVVPPDGSAEASLTVGNSSFDGQMLHRPIQEHINGRLSTLEEALASPQAGFLSSGELEQSASTIGSEVTVESSSVAESDDETQSESESVYSEEGSSVLEESDYASEIVQSNVEMKAEASRNELEDTSLIDHKHESIISLTVSDKSEEQEVDEDFKRESDDELGDLALISQAWSARTDTLPVTHKALSNYGALLTARVSKSGRSPHFLYQNTEIKSETSTQPLPEPHVHSPPRSLRRPPNIHTQYEFIEGYGVDDPLSWHRLGLAVESSFVPSRTKRTPIPWRARTVHSVLGSSETNEKMELEHSGFESLCRKINQTFTFIESTADDLAGHRMPEIRKRSKSRSTTPSRCNSAKHGRQGSFSVLNSVQASVYLAIPELEIPNGGESSQMVVLDRSRRYPLDPTNWTEGSSPTDTCVKRVAVQSRQSDSTVDRQTVRERRSSSRPGIWKATAKGLSFATKFQRGTRQRHSDRFGQKAKSIEYLLNHQLQSPIAADRRTAAKALGLLFWKDRATVNGLKDRVINDSDELVQMEASRSMLLLGVWKDCAIKVILSALRRGTNELRKELLTAIASSENVKLVDKTKVPSFSELISTVKTLLADKELELSAAICLGEMCVYDDKAKKVLLGKLDDSSYRERGLSLTVLIRQMNCCDDCVIESLLLQLKGSFSSKDRIGAASLIGQLNLQRVSRHLSIELIRLLETKLWDDPVKTVRQAAAAALKNIGKCDEKRKQIIKRLEDPDDHIRAHATTSLGTLGVKDMQQLRLLLDLIELDPSVYVRIQAVRAVAAQGIINSRVLRVLRDREKGEGPLSREASKAIKHLKQLLDGKCNWNETDMEVS